MVFLQSLDFIEVSVQRVRELSRSGYQTGDCSDVVSRFLFNAWNLSNYHSQLMPNSPKTMSKSLTFVVPSSLTSVGHVSL